jgi:Spy/CpxP family protein refolding chaperone
MGVHGAIAPEQRLSDRPNTPGAPPYTHLYARTTTRLPGAFTMRSITTPETHMPSSTLKSNLLNTRTTRIAAGSVVVVGALMATLTGVNAWADRGHGGEREAREQRGPGMRHVAHRPGGEGMPGGMLMNGRMLQRMLDDVKATEAQRTQIDKIQDTAREDIAKLHAQHGKLRQQTVQLLTAPTVDTAAIEKVRQQMLQQHDAISKRMITAMVDSSKVLTPEQRSTLATKFKERQERMEERRERGSHDLKRPEGAPPAPPKG